MTHRLITSALLLAASLAACNTSVELSSAATDSSEALVDDSQMPTTSEQLDIELDFELTDTDGNTHVLSDYLASGKTVVLEWFNPDCPYVKRYHKGDSAMQKFAASAGDNVVWLAVNSGAPGNEGAGLLRNQAARAEWDLPYPVLLDESGEVGRLFGATNTPHMFVIAPSGEIIYRGAIDDSEGRGTPSVESLVSRALTEFAAGEPVSARQVKAFGCSVKYAH